MARLDATLSPRLVLLTAASPQRRAAITLTAEVGMHLASLEDMRFLFAFPLLASAVMRLSLTLQNARVRQGRTVEPNTVREDPDRKRGARQWGSSAS
jgi:hypothetical protein